MAFRLILTTFALLMSVPASAAEQRFSVSNFEELIVEGDIIVNLETGKAPEAKAQGPRDKLSALRVERQGNVLRIRSMGLQSNRDAGGPVTVTLTGRNIRRLALIGAGRISATALDAEKTRLDLRGSGVIEVASLKAFRLTARMAGNGTLTIAKGEVVNSEVYVDGGSNFVSAGLVSQNLQLAQNGPAVTLLTVSNVAEINNSGSGSITIEGQGSCVIRKAGSATINCKKTGR